MGENWKRIRPGRYMHMETGIEIVHFGAHWVLFIVYLDRRIQAMVGRTKTLKAAQEWAEGAHGFVEISRRALAEAWREAYAEKAERESGADSLIGKYVSIAGPRGICGKVEGESEYAVTVRHPRGIVTTSKLNVTIIEGPEEKPRPEIGSVEHYVQRMRTADITDPSAYAMGLIEGIATYGHFDGEKRLQRIRSVLQAWAQVRGIKVEGFGEMK